MLRRMFVKRYIGLLGLLYFVPGCGGSDDSVDSSAGTVELCSANDPSIDIGTNHSHTLTIPIADISSETPGAYTLTTGAGHTHTLNLTATDIANLKDNGSLIKASSIDSSHSHDVTITCVG